MIRYGMRYIRQEAKAKLHTIKIKGYFNFQLVTGVSVQLYFPQCWFAVSARQCLQVLVSGLVYKVHVIIKHINNKIYREKSIPLTALWCPAFSNNG